jgi:hypothetical protein
MELFVRAEDVILINATKKASSLQEMCVRLECCKQLQKLLTTLKVNYYSSCLLLQNEDTASQWSSSCAQKTYI